MGELIAARVNLDDLKRVGIIAQKQKDYFLIRLRTVAGDLTTDELTVIMRVAGKFGGSRVHLTTRQAVEIHNIHESDLQAAQEELTSGGIVLGVCGPRARGIVACPGSATCTSGIIETKELAAELDALYFREKAPHKFKIGISGCPNNCSKPVENDIGIMGGVLPEWDASACTSCKLCVSICPVQAIVRKGETFDLDIDKCILCGLCINNCPTSGWKAKKTGYTLYLGGTMGKKPRLGTRAKVLIESKDDLLSAIKLSFDYYLGHGVKKERFGHTLDRIGVEKAFEKIFSEKVEKNLNSVSEVAESAWNRNLLDLRGVCCPLNFVKAKLAMEKIVKGDIIEIYLDDGEPIVNVTRSLKEEGHQVLLVTPESSYFRVMVEK